MPISEKDITKLWKKAVKDFYKDLFVQDDVFYASLKNGEPIYIASKNMQIPLVLKPGGKFASYDPPDLSYYAQAKLSWIDWNDKENPHLEELGQLLIKEKRKK